MNDLQVTENGCGLFQPQLYELGLVHLLGVVVSPSHGRYGFSQWLLGK